MKTRGFTIIELMIVIIIIAILTVIGAVTYHNVQKQAAENIMLGDLNNASTVLEQYALAHSGDFPDTAYLTTGLTTAKDVNLVVHSGGATGPVYTGLSAVQKGVLFYTICEEAIADPALTVIHSVDGTQTHSVQHRCNDNIWAGGLQITGWDSRNWTTPVTRTAIENYMASVPTDSWWIDKQQVVRAFYQHLIDTYEARGGTWPITSFWDPWANQWSGVHYEPLPDLDGPNGPLDEKSYCVQAYHAHYPDITLRITSDKLSPEPGTCASL